MIKRFIIALVLLVIVAGGLVGFNMFRDNAIQNYFANMPKPTLTVSTTTVESVVWHPTIPAIGTVRAGNGVDLTVESTGIVRDLLFGANGQVAKGDVLVQLDDEIQQADYNAAKTQAALNQQTLARAQELEKRGVGSQSNLDAANAAAQSSNSQVEKAQAALNQKQIRAPFSGTIGIPRIEVGQYLSPGTIVATLQDLTKMRVDFTVPEQQFSLLKIGQAIQIGLSEDELQFKGEIIGIDPKIDPSTRLVSIRAEISNPDGELNPGQFVRVRIDLPSEENIIAVPQTAVVTSLYGDYVYRLDKNEGDKAEGDEITGTLAQVFVKIGRRENSNIEIIDGLKVGDLVVNAGQNRLSHGANVRVNNSIQPMQAGGGSK